MRFAFLSEDFVEKFFHTDKGFCKFHKYILRIFIYLWDSFNRL